MTPAREATLSALLQVEENAGYSNLVLDKTIHQFGLSPQDASLATAIFYGVLERKLTLNYYLNAFSKQKVETTSQRLQVILQMAAYQILYLERVPDSAAVNEAVEQAGQDKRTKNAKGYVNGVLRTLSRQKEQLPQPKSRANSWYAESIRYSIPEWILAMWSKAYGRENTMAMAEAIEGRLPLYARVNTTKITRDALLAHLEKAGVTAQAVAGFPHAIALSHTGAVEQLEAYATGLFHVQDLSSQLCSAMLQPKAGETVADVCAAPGGKTFTMAEEMENQGTVLSFDLYKGKVGLIRKGAERLGLTNIKANMRDASDPKEALLFADKVLCDAPCSGLGILGRKPEIRYKNPKELAELSRIQKAILEESSKQVKAGGLLLYSTCSLNPKENGEVAEWFLQTHADFAPKALPLPQTIVRGIAEPDHMLTLLPHCNKTDGFFMALFQKREEG